MTGQDSPVPPDYDGKSFLRKTAGLAIYWKAFVCVLWPTLLLPSLVTHYEHKQVRCSFVVLTMIVLWVTEALPLGVTSMLPMVLFPSLGVLGTGETLRCYMNDTIMVFVGGLVLASAIEHSSLHMRIALGVMSLVGCSHRKLLAGLLLVIAFLSMWISNTACVAMMLPIVFAVLEELEKEGLIKMYHDLPDPEDPFGSRHPTNVTKAYLLATAYSSTFGGCSTLVGTGTNLALKGLFEDKFHQSPGINFTQWMVFATPQAMLLIALTYFYALIAYLGMFRPWSKAAKEARIGKEGEAIANKVIQAKYKDLGRINFHQKAVLVLFILAVVLWVFRKPGFMTGWADLIADTEVVKGKRRKVDIRDSVPILFVSVLMFIIPKEPTFCQIYSKDANARPTRPSEGLITWALIQEKLPWSLMFLLGGGFAISKGVNSSGLAEWIGELLIWMKGLSPFSVLCVICGLISQITELTSNIGTATIMLPIIAQISQTLEIHPLYLMLPATLICSYAFRLPSGTPPNAIVIVEGKMPAKSLIIGGCLPSMYGLLTTLILFPFWGVRVFGIEGFPDWAHPNNTHLVEH